MGISPVTAAREDLTAARSRGRRVFRLLYAHSGDDGSRPSDSILTVNIRVSVTRRRIARRWRQSFSQYRAHLPEGKMPGARPRPGEWRRNNSWSPGPFCAWRGRATRRPLQTGPIATASSTDEEEEHQGQSLRIQVGVGVKWKGWNL